MQRWSVGWRRCTSVEELWRRRAAAGSSGSRVRGLASTPENPVYVMLKINTKTTQTDFQTLIPSNISQIFLKALVHNHAPERRVAGGALVVTMLALVLDKEMHVHVTLQQRGGYHRERCGADGGSCARTWKEQSRETSEGCWEPAEA